MLAKQNLLQWNFVPEKSSSLIAQNILLRSETTWACDQICIKFKDCISSIVCTKLHIFYCLQVDN